MLGDLGHLLAPWVDWLISVITWFLSLVNHMLVSTLGMVTQWFLDLPWWQQFVIYLLGIGGLGIEDKSTEAGIVEAIGEYETEDIDGHDWEALFWKCIGMLIIYPIIGWARIFVGAMVLTARGVERAVESDWVSFSIFSGDVVSVSISGLLKKLR